MEKKVKVVVTGGSGFIGTNLIDLLEKLNYEIKNFDIVKPRNKNHISYWEYIDILNYNILLENLFNYQPDYIIHLAARTDLLETSDINGYSVNIDGVRNLMEAATRLHGLKKVIVASSMLVCRLGYYPNSFTDYAPNSLYGESKVLTEKIVKEYDLYWTIVRPTSIWGPWFDQPYKNFFSLVVKGLYFNIPSNYASTKTFGFVENTCHQMLNLMLSDNPMVKHNYFYLGDLEPINISVWANTIRKVNKQSNLLTFPIWFLKLTARVGDIFIKVFKFNKFPMNTFRFNNMTNDHIINDLYRTLEITKSEFNTNLEDQITKTLNWLKQNVKLK